MDILAVKYFHIFEALQPNGRAPTAMAVVAVVKFEACIFQPLLTSPYVLQDRFITFVYYQILINCYEFLNVFELLTVAGFQEV